MEAETPTRQHEPREGDVQQPKRRYRTENDRRAQERAEKARQKRRADREARIQWGPRTARGQR